MQIENLVNKGEFDDAFICFKKYYKTLEKKLIKLDTDQLEKTRFIWSLIKEKAADSPQYFEVYNSKWKNMTILEYLDNDI
jgi:hypothetical protein